MLNNRYLMVFNGLFTFDYFQSTMNSFELSLFIQSKPNQNYNDIIKIVLNDTDIDDHFFLLHFRSFDLFDMETMFRIHDV